MAENKKSAIQFIHARMIDYQRTFKSQSGQRVLNDLIDMHSCLVSTFEGDVNKMLVKEGERNVVLRMLTILKTDPHEFLRRVEENEQNARSNRTDTE